MRNLRALAPDRVAGTTQLARSGFVAPVEAADLALDAGVGMFHPAVEQAVGAVIPATAPEAAVASWWWRWAKPAGVAVVAGLAGYGAYRGAKYLGIIGAADKDKDKDRDKDNG